MSAENQRFKHRSCPSCFASEPRPLFRLSPSQFIYPSYNGARYASDPHQMFGIVRCGRCSFVYSETAPSDALKVALRHARTRRGSGAASLSSTRLGRSPVEAGERSTRGYRQGFWRYSARDFGFWLRLRCPGSCARRTNGRIGFETSEFMVRYLQKEGLPVVNRLSDAPRNLHGIILSDVLEHLPEPRIVLRELRARLLPKGLLCLNVPDFSESRIRMIERQLKHGHRPPQDLNPWEHLNYFSPKTLRRILRDEGFHIVEPQVEIGLRAHGVSKIGNAIKSLGRLLAYAANSRNNVMLVLAQT